MNNKILIFALLTVLFIGLSSSFVSAAAAADCSTSQASDESLSTSNAASTGLKFGFYGGVSNFWGTARPSYYLDRIKDATVTSSDISQVFNYYPSTLYGYAYNTLTGGVHYDYDCEMGYRAGTYIYGYPGKLTVKLWSDGTEGGRLQSTFDKPQAFVGVQVYELYDGAGYDPIWGLMGSVSSNNPVSVGQLLANPISSSPLHLSGVGDQGSVYEYLSLPPGVYYIAVAGGHNNRNEDWNDDYETEISLSGTYKSFSHLLEDETDIKNNLPLTYFKSYPSLCELAGGAHIKNTGVSTSDIVSGEIYCCGARNDDVGKFNYQYRCDYVDGEYVWTNLCELDYDSLTGDSKTRASSCLVCEADSIDGENYAGYCIGEGFDVYCDNSQTKSCSNFDDDRSKCLLAGCGTFVPGTQCECSGVDCSSGEVFVEPIGSAPGSAGCYTASEMQATFGVSDYCDSVCAHTDGTDYPSVVIDYTDGDCGGTSSYTCNFANDNTCLALDCRLRDDAANYYYSIPSGCYENTYIRNNKPECFAVGCGWKCRTSDGNCDTSIDCTIGNHCSDDHDPDELDSRTCHSDATKCIVGYYDGYINGGSAFSSNDHVEVGVGTYVCAEDETGVGVYKQCGIYLEPYSYGSCTSTSAEFTCTGTPDPQVCKSSTLYCSNEWIDGPRTASSCTSINGNCHYSEGQCYDSDGGSGGGAYAGIFNDVSIPLVSGFTFETCPEAGTQSVCEAMGCSWSPATCTGTYTKSCSGTPPCASWCYADPSFTSCTGLSYAQCTTGCTRSCKVTGFGSAVNKYTNSNLALRESACDCAGDVWETCYIDSDEDGFPSSSQTNLCVGSDYVEGEAFAPSADPDNLYFCGSYTGVWDCDDNDDSVYPLPYYLDNDGDGSGDSSMEDLLCSPPSGWVDVGGDCDDDDPCLVPWNIWYYDGDDDGFYNSTVDSTDSCTPLTNYVTNRAECSSEDFYVSSLLPDCDDSISSCTSNCNTGYRDADEDGYPLQNDNITPGCSSSGYILERSDGAWDCDDSPSTGSDIYRLANVCPDSDSDGVYVCESCETDVCVGDFVSDNSNYVGFDELTYSDCNDINSEDDCDDGNITIYRLANMCPDFDDDTHYDCDACQTDVCANDNVPTSHPDYIEWTQTQCLAAGETDCDDSQSDRWRVSTVHKDDDYDGYYDCANPLVDQCIGCDDPNDGFCKDSYMPVDSYGVTYTDDYASTCTYDNAISDCNDNDVLLYHLCCNNANSYEFKKSSPTYTFDSSKTNTILYKVRMDNYDTSWTNGEPRIDGNDWPFNNVDWSLATYTSDGKTLFDKSIYGCAASSTASVYYDVGPGNVVVVENNGGVNFISHDGSAKDRVTKATNTYCDSKGCPWVDCDNNAASASQCGYPFLLEGKSLKSGWNTLSDNGLYNPDDSAERGFGGYTDYDGTAYDVRQTRNESCGDDMIAGSSEYATIGFCEASTDYRRLCCVSPNMYNMDGICVAYDQCPDVMESAPVWIDSLSQAEYDSYVAILAVSGDGYCCDNEGPSVGKELCVASEKGCYIKTASLAETPIPKPGYVQNWNDCPAGSCALELCSSATNYSLCEKSTTCESEVYKLYVPGITNLKECHPISGGLSITAEKAASYPSMQAGCDESSCERVTETICTLDTSSNSCYALCNDDKSECELVCAQSDYTCSNVETLRNCEDPSCVYDNTNPVISYRYNVDTTQSLSCESDYFTECNEFGCAPPKYCGGIPPDGTLEYFANCGAYPPLYTHNVVCDEHVSCSNHDCNESQALNSADNLVCLPEVTGALDVEGNNYPKLAMNDNLDTLQCSPETTIKVKGQPFCPEGFDYDVTNTRCIKSTYNCDYGYRGALVNGCDNLTRENDPYLMYTSGCFQDSSGLDIDSVNDLNAKACCLDYSIVSGSDIYDVYTIESGEEYIRIY